VLFQLLFFNCFFSAHLSPTPDWSGKNGAKCDAMNDRVIPLIDERARSRAVPAPGSALSAPALSSPVLDQFARALSDLRISVTDRCNFRCSYCMPKEVFNSSYTYLPQKALLSFEEITRLAKIFVSLGTQKIRLTGGEPLLRKNLELLIGQLSQIKTPSGQALDLTLTTNGSLLSKKASALKLAGLQRITVSLDALDDRVFKAMNDVDFPVEDVLQGIQAAQAAGLGLDEQGLFSGLKINMVVKKGTNEHEILPMARRFLSQGLSLRFIEYMDVGSTNGWRMQEVMPSKDVLALLRTEFDLVPVPTHKLGETAQRFGLRNQSGVPDPRLGEVGLISSVTQAFCADCTRARLSTEGLLYLCLFATEGHDLKTLLHSGLTDPELAQSVGGLWQRRDDRYSLLRAQDLNPQDNSEAGSNSKKRVEMSYIGG
jgi:cyclic pyranopterin phosphate synthase